MTTTPQRPKQPGDRAPSFTLPAINREGVVALDEYRGKQPLLVGLFRGLSCPFCRRHLVQLSATQEKLKPTGVESTIIGINPPMLSTWQLLSSTG